MEYDWVKEDEKSPQTNFACATRVQPCTAETSAAPCRLMHSLKPELYSLQMISPNTCSQARPFRAHRRSSRKRLNPRIVQLSVCLSVPPLTVPTTGHVRLLGMRPVSPRSQAAWVLRQRPLIQWCCQSKMKGQWSAHKCRFSWRS